MSTAPPVFGKRNASLAPRPAGPATSAAALAPAPAAPIADVDYAAFLAATRQAFAKPAQDGCRVAVPRSVMAAFLAAVIVGCCLVGLDIARARDATSAGGTVIHLSALMGGGLPVTGGGGITPSLILAGILGGARAAVVCLLIGHAALSRLGLTGHFAYAAAGAASLLALAGAMSFAIGMPPSHGWLVTGFAGAGAGFFYRMFAGAPLRAGWPSSSRHPQLISRFGT